MKPKKPFADENAVELFDEINWADELRYPIIALALNCRDCILPVNPATGSKFIVYLL